MRTAYSVTASVSLPPPCTACISIINRANVRLPIVCPTVRSWEEAGVLEGIYRKSNWASIRSYFGAFILGKNNPSSFFLGVQDRDGELGWQVGRVGPAIP